MIHRGQIDGIKLYLLPRLVKLKSRKKKNSYSNYPKKNKKVLGNSIEKRPKHINSRSEKGHYEIDAIKGKNGKEKKIPKIQEALNGRCTKILGYRSSEEYHFDDTIAEKILLLRKKYFLYYFYFFVALGLTIHLFIKKNSSTSSK